MKPDEMLRKLMEAKDRYLALQADWDEYVWSVTKVKAEKKRKKPKKKKIKTIFDWLRK